jgi:Xaa-Pro aminopeptidase
MGKNMNSGRKMSEKLEALRRLMEKRNIQAYLVPGTDPHRSESVPECWRRLSFITGFTGSSGDALVTMRQAGLWTDSRYYLQAERELRGTGFRLFRWGLPGVPSWKDWAARSLKPGEALGLDPRLISYQEYMTLEKTLARRSVRLRPLAANLIDRIWQDRPPAPAGKLMVLEERYAGESVRQKLAGLRRKMAAEGADAHVLSPLDAIAWLFNIRGSDVPYSPVAIAHAVVSRKRAYLFLDKAKITPSVRKALGEDVAFRSYEDFGEVLRDLSRTRKKVWLDETGVSQWVVRTLSGARLVFQPSPVTLAKAVKNAAEIRGAKAAHRRDGAAMVEFLWWLKKTVPKGGVTELGAARKLEEFRKFRPRFRGLSFRTISAYGSHGAIVHYSVTPGTDIPLRPEGIYLVDSGSQYLDATTDVTRTVCLGRPTAEQRERFTRVLKGVVNLTRTPFPQGTSGPQIDVLARRPLWEAGLDYGHGTGHGIGSYLNVHEGPQAIAPGRGSGLKLEPGMILSIEPGIYKKGEYGLRLENVALIVRDRERSRQMPPFLKFETLTLCPIELGLVDKALMTAEEAGWLNAYHRKVRKVLTPLLSKGAALWLKKATRPI